MPFAFAPPPLQQLAAIARKAGDAIMQFYHKQNYQVHIKADKSPFTDADATAHNILCRELRALDTGSPIFSEESHRSSEITAPAYWLLDPLDGTREFVNHSGQFTVNIAYIQAQKAVLGMVYAPAIDKLYCGINSTPKQALLGEGNKPWRPIHSRHKRSKELSLYASLRHDDETKLRQFLAQHYNLDVGEFVKMGSSLKLCLIAEGKGDAYLRLTPTHIWDTAAAHAVLAAAAGEVLEADNKTPLAYRKDILNPPFIAVSQALLSELTQG